MQIGQTIDELATMPLSGVTDSALLAIRDMAVPNTHPQATKALPISTLNFLVAAIGQSALRTGSISLTLGVPATVTFATPMTNPYFYLVKRGENSNGDAVACQTSSETANGFTVQALIEDCTFYYCVAQTVTGVVLSNLIQPLALTNVQNGDVIKYQSSNSTWINGTVSKASLGLDQVDNTSDANKPVSTATSTALGLKRDKTSVTATLLQFPRCDGYPANTTRYMTLLTGAPLTTIDNCLWISGAGTYKNLRIFMLGNSSVTNVTFTLMEVTAFSASAASTIVATTLTKQAAASSTGILSEDLVNSVVVNDGAMLGIRVVSGSNGGFSPVSFYLSMDFIPTP